MRTLIAFFVVSVIAGCSKKPAAEEPFAVAIKPSPKPEMVWIPGGTFFMGNDPDPEGNAPRHPVTVRGFWMDNTEVTNAQFAEFVKATGYVTVAERLPTPEEFRGPVPADAKAFSICFVPVDESVPLFGPWDSGTPPWWKIVNGASWRHPDGPDSTIDGKDDYPVVHISWHDAAAYAKWAGKRLPTEAEWEFAARGGLDGEPFTWGKELQGLDGKYRANTFQGTFPVQDRGSDGFTGPAPVGQFEPNGYKLFDMSGNVWEWCSDWYDPTYYQDSPLDNPTGPATGIPNPMNGNQLEKVRRGGSYLCADNYCRRYLPGARDHNPPNDAACHTGFRCVRDK
jgi:formylglycine-generating enzyme